MQYEAKLLIGKNHHNVKNLTLTLVMQNAPVESLAHGVEIAN